MPRERITHAGDLRSTMQFNRPRDRSARRSLNLIMPIHRYLSIFSFLDRDCARGDDESHRSVRHQEHWSCRNETTGKGIHSAPGVNSLPWHLRPSPVYLVNYLATFVWTTVSLRAGGPVTRCIGRWNWRRSHQFI